MVRKYELVLVYDSDLNDEGLKQQLEKVETTITAHAGTVEVRDVWGRRLLAYPMKKKNYGIFVMLVVTGDNTLVGDLKRQLRINDAVLRSFITKKDKFAPDLAVKMREESGSADSGYQDERRDPDAAASSPDEAGA